MSEKAEIRITKAITIILVSVLIIFIGNNTALALVSEDKAVIVSDIFAHYNHKLSPRQSRELAGLVLQAGERFQIDPFLLASIIVRESSARPWAISKGGDYGLMQVRWRVHQKEIRRKYPQVRDASDLLKPEINIPVGAEIFAGYYAKQKTIHGGLLRYSAGNKTLAKRVLSTFNELNKRYQEVKK